MENLFLKSLDRSIINAANETNQYINYFNKNKIEIIFFPHIISTDIDYQNYCNLLSAIKNQASKENIPIDFHFISDQIKTLPTLTAKDFKIFGTLPVWLLYVIIPLGIVYWIGFYLKIDSLITKLRTIESKLQSISYSIRININN